MIAIVNCNRKTYEFLEAIFSILQTYNFYEWRRIVDYEIIQFELTSALGGQKSHWCHNSQSCEIKLWNEDVIDIVAQVYAYNLRTV